MKIEGTVHKVTDIWTYPIGKEKKEAVTLVVKSGSDKYSNYCAINVYKKGLIGIAQNLYEGDSISVEIFLESKEYKPNKYMVLIKAVDIILIKGAVLKEVVIDENTEEEDLPF